MHSCSRQGMGANPLLPILCTLTGEGTLTIGFLMIHIIIDTISAAYLIMVKSDDARVWSRGLARGQCLVERQDTFGLLTCHLRSGRTFVGLEQIQQRLMDASGSWTKDEQPLQQQNEQRTAK